MKRKVMCVFGTRPEANKMCPLVKELESREEVESLVCVTAQHREMLDQMLAAFDVQPSAANTADGKPIYPMDQLQSFCKANKVLMGIITVPVKHAQQVCDQLIECGIKAVWNFAPTHLEVPDHILVQNENMATSLAVLSMHLQAQMKEKK